MKLNEAKVLITGGNSGIGKATAKLLKERGAHVVIAGRNSSTLQKVSEELHIPFVQADVTKEDEVESLIRQTIRKLNNFNVLVNNAGYGYTANLVDIDHDKLIDQLHTNVVGAAIVAKHAAKHFIDHTYGNIINIGSTASLNGSPGASPYVATKFALRGMTASWRNELRPHNIRVMQVNPSEVMTNFVDNRVDANKNKKVYTEAEKESKLRGDEIAHTICSLLEMDDRGFITEATVFATNPKT